MVRLGHKFLVRSIKKHRTPFQRGLKKEEEGRERREEPDKWKKGLESRGLKEKKKDKFEEMKEERPTEKGSEYL